MTALPPPRGGLAKLIVAAALAGWLIGITLAHSMISYRQAHPSPKILLRR